MIEICSLNCELQKKHFLGPDRTGRVVADIPKHAAVSHAVGRQGGAIVTRARGYAC